MFTVDKRKFVLNWEQFEFFGRLTVLSITDQIMAYCCHCCKENSFKQTNKKKNHILKFCCKCNGSVYKTYCCMVLSKEIDKVQRVQLNVITVNVIICLTLSVLADSQRQEPTNSSNMTEKCVWLLLSFG